MDCRKSMKPQVTVIVPIYNVEKYVAKCLESLKQQSFSDYVVWAVDDGSPDNSKDVVKKYATNDKRIKLIQKENGGYGSVLEYCIKNIKTKYFLVCDPDDWLDKTALMKLYNYATKNDTDIVIGDRYNVYTDDFKPIIHRTRPAKLQKIEPKKVYTDRKIIQKFAFFDPSPHAKLFKTSIVRDTVFPHHVSFTDFLLYLSALANTERISYYNEPLAYYLLDRPGNTATDQRPSTIKEHMIVWSATLNNIIKVQRENGILLYDLSLGLIQMLPEYARLTKSTFHDEYWQIILKSINNLRNVKDKVTFLGHDTKIEMFFLKKILYSNTPIKYAKIYVKLMAKKWNLKKQIKKLIKKG